MEGRIKIGFFVTLLLVLGLLISFSGSTLANKIGTSGIKYSVINVDNNKKAIILNLAEDIKLSELSKLTGKPASYYLRLEKKAYFGDAEVELMEKVNVTKQRVKRTWRCNCTNKTVFLTSYDNRTGENITIKKTIKVCQICKEYENYTVEEMRVINPENFVLKKDKPIYEVFKGCIRIERLPNGKWGCSVWTDVFIYGIKIEGATWWNSSWNYRQAINIFNTAGNLTDYQTRIDLNSTNVGTHFNWSTNGSDIRFTNLTGYLLDHWIEYWNSSSQEAIIWVKVPYLENNTNTTIYMYYGNPSATSASDVNSTFIRVIDGVVGSWHFDEGEGTTAYDYSGNDNDGDLKNDPQWTDGKFGKALSFDGVDDYVEIVNPSGLPTGSQSRTIELWTKPNIHEKMLWIWWGTENINKGNGLRLARDEERITYGIRYYFWGNDLLVETGDLSKAWHHVVAVYDEIVNKQKIYVDGVLKGERTPTQPDTDYTNLFIGMRSNSEFFNGTIDEVRIYNRALSEEEIQDLYNYYGYTTENYPGKTLVRKKVEPEPLISIEEEEIIKIEGYVKDPYGNPIEGARVNIIKQSTTGNDTLLATVITNASGYYYYETTEKGYFMICAYLNSTTKCDCKSFVKI